jgi:hypothetical protein
MRHVSAYHGDFSPMGSCVGVGALGMAEDGCVNSGRWKTMVANTTGHGDYMGTARPLDSEWREKRREERERERERESERRQAQPRRRAEVQRCTSAQAGGGELSVETRNADSRPGPADAPLCTYMAMVRPDHQEERLGG